MSDFSNFTNVKFEKSYKVRRIMINTLHNSKLIDILKLPRLESLDDLAYFLLFTKDQLNDFIYRKPEHYNTFLIPKKHSKQKRVINAPKKRLKMAQKLILKEILEHIPCSDVSTAFIKNENGLIKNAITHKENLFLLKMDFQNFFQNIKEQKIIQVFNEIGYDLYISRKLAQLCSFSRHLPQGGICSPYLSNLACYELDNDICDYCNERNISYTRYADDLIFSSNDIDLLEQLKMDIKGILAKHYSSDFQITLNDKKTKLVKNTSHKKVTGITINDHMIKASKKIKNQIRQNIRYDLLHDICDNKLIGRISFVISIEGIEYKEKIAKYSHKIATQYNIDKNNRLLKILYKMTN